MADVYSSTGLETSARLNERMGKLADAEQRYKQILKRYGDGQGIATFYFRHADTNPEYKRQSDSIFGKYFPGGLEHYAPAADQPPVDGVRIGAESPRTEALGLSPENIVVAVNGYRVRNIQQFMLASDTKLDPAIEYTWWNGKTYKSGTVSLPDHRLKCSISNYRSGPPKN